LTKIDNEVKKYKIKIGDNRMLKRFSISLEESLLKKFDSYIGKKRYMNRSEAIRDLIRDALVADEWSEDREVFGVITLVFDHHLHNIQEKLTELQHDYHSFIVSSTHIHVDHDNCLEVIIVKGTSTRVQELSQKLKILRGVKNSSLSMSSKGDNLA
jgi:CopG family transcriptional regulator, nickel-responsive regulator